MANIVVIGLGKMGTALGLAFKKAGHTIMHGVATHPASPESQRFKSLTQADVSELNQAHAPLKAADLILITVPDKAVTDTAQTLVRHDLLSQRQIVAHTAGALSSDVLDCVRAHASAISMHPLQTVANPALGPTLLRGVTFTVEGDESACHHAMDWVESIGGIPVRIDARTRPQYHAAAVLASNAVVALANVAAQLSGLESGVHALLPLMKGAIQNLEQLGATQALTGPVERNDVSTVMKHLHAMEHNPTTTLVYAALGLATADVAKAKGSLTSEQWTEFRRIFTEAGRFQNPGGMLFEQASYSSNVIEDETSRRKNCHDDSL